MGEVCLVSSTRALGEAKERDPDRSQEWQASRVPTTPFPQSSGFALAAVKLRNESHCMLAPHCALRRKGSTGCRKPLYCQLGWPSGNWQTRTTQKQVWNLDKAFTPNYIKKRGLFSCPYVAFKIPG
jgi:hypothetical protein